MHSKPFSWKTTAFLLSERQTPSWILHVYPIIISFKSYCVRKNSGITRLFPDALMRIRRPIKGRLALLSFTQENCAKSKHGARCVLIIRVSLAKPACIYWNNHSSADLMNPSRNECKDETSKTSDFWEYHGLARDGINLLLNNGFEESQKLFRSHRYNKCVLLSVLCFLVIRMCCVICVKYTSAG